MNCYFNRLVERCIRYVCVM